MNRALLLILAVSGLLGLGYAWATPAGGAPDEGAHAEYVRVVLDEHRLPVLDLSRRRNSHADKNYEAHQPPLYYLLAVPFYAAGRAAGGETGAAQACRILSILIGLAATYLVWRLARELVPDRPLLALTAAGMAALLPMRLSISASVSNDMLTEATCSLALLLMVRAVRRPMSARDAAFLGLALSAALLTKQSSVLLFPPVLLALLLSSEADDAPEAAARLRSGLRQSPGAAEETRDLARSGRTKKSARRPGQPRAAPDAPKTPSSPSVRVHSRLSLLRNCAVLAGAVLALSGWWFVRNRLLYGDPLGQRAFNWYFQDTPRWADFRDSGVPFTAYLFQMVLPTTFASFWGAFGHMQGPQFFMGGYRPGAEPLGPLTNTLHLFWPIFEAGGSAFIPYRSWLYPLLVLATLVAAAGGVRYYLRYRAGKTPEGPPPYGLGILALHGVFAAAALLNFNVTYFQGQGRYLFPAMAILAMALAGGWLEWSRPREAAAAGVILGGMFCLALYALLGVVRPAFGM